MRERELRLALICYGGISLAVYMHGITKEVWHLASASRALHDGGPGGGGSRGVYHALLAHIEARCGIRMRAVVDILSGSSAGGLNAIFLAEAIATGHSLDPLTDLWLERADVDELLDPDARPLSAFTKFWARPIAWALLRRRRGALAQMVSSESREEVARKLSRFVRARWFAPPFGGPVFSGLILDALDALHRTPAGPVLLPSGHPLDLYVTMTDFYGHPQTLRLNSPPQVSETEHRVTLSFSTRAVAAEARAAGGIAHPAELTFAARATASFPGAFPAFHIGELDRLLDARGIDWPGRGDFLARSFPHRWASGTAEDVILIDGSVLANAPFAQAIRALRNRPARREIDRRFVYIDPLPGDDAFHFGPRRGGGGVVPGFFSTIIGASSDIPREQPIRDNLEAIETRSRRISEMLAITRSLRPEVERTVETMLGRTLLLSWPTPRRITAWRQRAQEKAARSAGFTFAAYGHLKLSGIVDDLVATIRRALPELDRQSADAARRALLGEITRRGLDNLSAASGGATSEAIAFFRAHDLRFRIRRLRFLARRLGEDVEAASSTIDPAAEALHDAIYATLAEYLELETIAFLGAEFRAVAQAVEQNPGALLDWLAARRQLEALDEASDAALCRALAPLQPGPQRTMLLAYLGFPLYDIATLPLLQGEGLDEFDPIKVDRISPDDAPALAPADGLPVLRGTDFNNFGAFFSRSYRENDYLWGRIHGAERMIDILLSALPPDEALPPDSVAGFKRSAFLAILDEEEPRLPRIAPLIADLRARLSSWAESGAM